MSVRKAVFLSSLCLVSFNDSVIFYLSCMSSVALCFLLAGLPVCGKVVRGT